MRVFLFFRDERFFSEKTDDGSTILRCWIFSGWRFFFYFFKEEEKRTEEIETREWIVDKKREDSVIMKANLSFFFRDEYFFFRDSEATNDYSDGSMKGGNLVMELLIFITLKLKIIEVEKFEADGIVRSVFRGGNRFFLGISFLKFCLLQLPVRHRRRFF